MYLAQNTQSLSKAEELVNFWNRYKFNPGEDSVELLPPQRNVKIYAYLNDRDIRPLVIPENAIDGVILGYRIEGTPNYTALLRI